MVNIFYLTLLFVMSYETIPDPANPTLASYSYMYLPMKKDHKYGDDICYYREYDEKSLYFIYYVKPCEEGKYCQEEISSQPFGYCVDIPYSKATISNWKESCESDLDCQNDLTCENSECNKPSNTCSNQVLYQKYLTTFTCRANDERIEDNLCEKYEYTYDPTTNNPTKTNTIYGNYPGLPNQCGLINFKPVNYKRSVSGELVNDIQYIKENQAWCTIGSVPDNEFVTDSKYCYSGFSLKFYPNKSYPNPSQVNNADNSLHNLCVTPISIDNRNELAGDGCIITYKILDQNPKQYNSNKAGVTCSSTIVIKSERYREFIDAFKEANEEDKKNCYNLDLYQYRCKNSKLIKLWYFYKNIEDYLFFKDRDTLKTVLDFKIQKVYPTYSFTQYMNYSFLLFLLFLINI